MRVAYSLAFILIALVVVAPAFAEVTKQIAVQGVLKDNVGNPINDPKSVTFRIYDNVTGGSMLSIETQTITPSENGLFSTMLTNVSSLAFDKDYWLNISVDGQDLSPLQKLTPAPYALAIPNVVSLGGKIAIGANATTALSTRTLNVIDENAVPRFWRFTNNTGLDAAVEIIWGNNGSAAGAAGNYYWDIGVGNGSLFIRDRSSGQPSNAQRLVINNQGNVGIGTASPTKKLEINGTLAFTTNNSGYKSSISAPDATLGNFTIVGTMGDNDYWKLAGIGLSDAGVLKILTGDGGNEPIVFGQVASGTENERMRIHSNGNVGIGTTSPSQLLTVDVDDINGVAIAIPSVQTDTCNGNNASLYTCSFSDSKPICNDTFTNATGNFTRNVTCKNGNALISGNARAASFTTDLPSGAWTHMEFLRNGSKRWAVMTNANDASQIQFVAYNDSGGEFAKPLVINRLNGNVGIGTTNPTQKLDVNGDVNINGSIMIPAGKAMTIGGLSILQQLVNDSPTVRPDSTNVTGGNLPSGTYCYQVTAYINNLETTATSVCAIVGSGDNAVNLSMSWPGSGTPTEYRIYGRNETIFGRINTTTTNWYVDKTTAAPNTTLLPPSTVIRTDISGAGKISANTLVLSGSTGYLMLPRSPTIVAPCNETNLGMMYLDTAIEGNVNYEIPCMCYKHNSGYYWRRLDDASRNCD